MGCFKSNALALRHSHRSPRNESDSGRLFGSPAGFKFAIGASFKKLQSDSFQNDFAPHPILLFQKNEGMAEVLPWLWDKSSNRPPKGQSSSPRVRGHPGAGVAVLLMPRGG